MSAGPRFRQFSSFSPYRNVLIAPDRYEYLWEDGVKFKRPTKLPAPEYVDALMNWAQNLLDDESVFPNRIGKYCFSIRDILCLTLVDRHSLSKELP